MFVCRQILHHKIHCIEIIERYINRNWRSFSVFKGMVVNEYTCTLMVNATKADPQHQRNYKMQFLLNNFK